MENQKNDSNSDIERPEFYAFDVALLECVGINREHADGEPALAITLARKSGIESLAFSLADGRLLALQLLVALATNGDQFARKLLDNNFSSNEEGEFHWRELGEYEV